MCCDLCNEPLRADQFQSHYQCFHVDLPTAREYWPQPVAVSNLDIA